MCRRLPKPRRFQHTLRPPATRVARVTELTETSVLLRILRIIALGALTLRRRLPPPLPPPLRHLCHRALVTRFDKSTYRLHGGEDLATMRQADNTTSTTEGFDRA